MCTADVDGDGKLDAVVLNASGVSVLIGNGDGTFQPPVQYTVGGSLLSVRIGDFNGDGKPDIAVIGFVTSLRVSVLLGNGNGTFQSAVITDLNVPLTATPQLVVADFNGDGRADVATIIGLAGFGQTAIAVLLGNGDGTFQSAKYYDSPAASAYYLASGDFNGDGRPDLFVAHDFAFPPASVSVLLGNGDGTFQSPIATPSGGCCNLDSSFALGDFNQDGKLDILVGGGPCDTCNGQLLLGNGDGTFQPAITLASSLQNISTADFNGDGILDVVSNDGGNTSVFLGKGDGTFSFSAVIWGNGQVRTLGTIADVKGDGKEDVLLLGNGLLSVVLGNGDGTFQLSTQNSPVPESVECCQLIASAADLNADGKPDLIFFLSAHIQNGITGAIGVDLGNGDGTFQSGLVSLSGSNTQTSSAVADFNDDGKLDLAVQGSILLGNGDGTFQPPTEYSFGGEAEVSADFNNDGKLDLASVSGIYSTVDLMFGNGDGTFALPTSITLANSYVGHALTTADFNRDGNADIVVTGTLGTIVLLLGNGKGSFSEQDLMVGSDFMTGVATGDFNGDGIPDLAAGVTPLSSSGPQNNVVAVLIGNGDGTFQPPMYYPVDPFPHQVAVRDLNGDGIPDIVTSNNFGTLSILLGKGDGTFQTAINYDGGEGGPVVVADFNGDGLPDLATGTEVIFNTTVGIVASPSVTLSTTSVNFGTHPINSSNSSSVILNNTGNASLNVAGLAIMGADPNQFRQSNSCGVLVANASCTITVQFTPNSAGNLAATLSIEDNALNSPQVIYLSGTSSDFGLSPTSANLTIKAGATASLTLIVTPLSGFSQSVTFSCSGLPAATTCNFLPTSIAPSGSAINTVLSIGTTAPSAVAAVPLLRYFAGMGAAGLVLCFLPVGYPKSSRRRFKVSLSIFAFLCLGACGGGSSGPPSNSNSGTPTGTYTVTASAIS